MLAGYLLQTACELREGKALLNLFEVRQKLEMRRRDMKWANQWSITITSRLIKKGC